MSTDKLSYPCTILINQLLFEHLAGLKLCEIRIPRFLVHKVGRMHNERSSNAHHLHICKHIHLYSNISKYIHLYSNISIYIQTTHVNAVNIFMLNLYVDRIIPYDGNSLTFSQFISNCYFLIQAYSSNNDISFQIIWSNYNN